MTTTTHYNLNCPEASDYYNIEHQNDNMERIDEALSTLFGTGTYIGDGEESRFIQLPRTPKFVLVAEDGLLSELDSGFRYHAGLALEGAPAVKGKNVVEICEGGFRVSHFPNEWDATHVRLMMNTTGARYSYLWG